MLKNTETARRYLQESPYLVLVPGGVFTEDGAVGKPTEPQVENEALLGLDGAEVALWVGFDDEIHHRHLLLVWEKAEHHQRGVSGYVFLV